MTGVHPAVDLGRVVNLAGFEALASERMAGPAFDYVAGGSWDEITLAESVEAWRQHRFVPACSATSAPSMSRAAFALPLLGCASMAEVNRDLLR